MFAPDAHLTSSVQGEDKITIHTSGVPADDVHPATRGRTNPRLKSERITPFEGEGVVQSRHKEETAAIEVHVAIVANDWCVIDRFNIETNALAHHVVANVITDGVISHQVDFRRILTIEIRQRGVVERGR